MSDIDLTIRSGGEDTTIFDIMQRYRNDGSCEAIIREALVLLAGREDGDNAHFHGWHDASCNSMSPCDLGSEKLTQLPCHRRNDIPESSPLCIAVLSPPECTTNYVSVVQLFSWCVA